MTVYRNKDPKKNFGDKTGKEFGIIFEGDSSYFIFKDGSKRFIEKNRDKRELFERAVNHPDCDVYCVEFQDIKWNILDFS